MSYYVWLKRGKERPVPSEWYGLEIVKKKGGRLIRKDTQDVPSFGLAISRVYTSALGHHVKVARRKPKPYTRPGKVVHKVSL